MKVTSIYKQNIQLSLFSLLVYTTCKMMQTIDRNLFTESYYELLEECSSPFQRSSKNYENIPHEIKTFYLRQRFGFQSPLRQHLLRSRD